MTLIGLRRSTEYTPVSTNSTSDYNPQRVRRSLLGERRWSYAVESASSAAAVRPRLRESFTATKSSCSASIIFDSPTLFPYSLSPPELDQLHSVTAPADPESRRDNVHPFRSSSSENYGRHIHLIDGIRSHQNDTSSTAKPRAKTIRSFNARLNNFAQKGNYLEILSLIEEVQNGTVSISGPLNTYSFTILLKAYCNAGNLSAARKLLDTMHTFDENKRPNRFTYNTLMNAFIRWEDMNGATELFQLMESNVDENIHPDHVTYTTLMKGYAASGNMEAALVLFQRLRDHPDPKCRPNQVTYNTMLKGFVAEGDMDSADRLMEEMLYDSDCRPDIVSMNTIIGGYARQGNLQRAREQFEQMRIYRIAPNAVTFHALIEGAIRHGDLDYADELFQAAISNENMTLSAATYRIVIDVWLRLGHLQKAEFAFCHQTSLADEASQPNQATCMLMAAAYSKSGMMDKSAMMFSRSNSRRRSSLNGCSTYDPVASCFEPSELQQYNSLRARNKRESVGSFKSDDCVLKQNEQF